MDIGKLQYLSRQVEELKGDYLILPEPKRLSLPPVKEMFQELLGQDLLVIETLLDEGYTPSDAAKVAWNEGSIKSRLASKGFNIISVTSAAMFIEYSRSHHPIMTFRESLIKRLVDFGISDSIPAGMFSMPGASVYVELGQGQERKTGFEQPFSNPQGVFEGFYYTQRDNYVIPIISDFALETLGMEKDQPVTVIDIKLCYSPYYGASNEKVVSYDRGVSFSLIIPDPDEPLNQIIEKNLKVSLRTTRKHVENSWDALNPSVFQTIRDACAFITKSVLYMTSEMRKQINQFEQTELKQKLEKVGDKKKKKLVERIKRSYDKILIGPSSQYVPIDERIKGYAKHGKVAPHYRRGYLGVRWVGTGKDKKAVLRPVKHTIVNKDQLMDGQEPEFKDFDVF